MAQVAGGGSSRGGAGGQTPGGSGTERATGVAQGGGQQQNVLEPLQEAEAQVQPPEHAAIGATGLQEMKANIVGRVIAQGRAAGGDAADVRNIGAPHPFQAEGQEDHTGAEVSDVDKVLIVCGIEDTQTRKTIRISEAFATLEIFRLLEDENTVDAWLKRASHKRAPNNLTIGEVQVYNLKGLAYWIQDRIAHELPLDANLFDRDALHEAIEMQRLEKRRKQMTTYANLESVKKELAGMNGKCLSPITVCKRKAHVVDH